MSEHRSETDTDSLRAERGDAAERSPASVGPDDPVTIAGAARGAIGHEGAPTDATSEGGDGGSDQHAAQRAAREDLGGP